MVTNKTDIVASDVQIIVGNLIRYAVHCNCPRIFLFHRDENLEQLKLIENRTENVCSQRDLHLT